MPTVYKNLDFSKLPGNWAIQVLIYVLIFLRKKRLIFGRCGIQFVKLCTNYQTVHDAGKLCLESLVVEIVI